MKISHFEMLDEKYESYLDEALSEHSNDFFSKPLTHDNLEMVRDAEIITARVYSQLTRRVIEELPHLKYIALRVTGYDNVDVKAAEERGIPVSNVPEYGSDTVAEYTFAHILNLTRRFHHTLTTVGQKQVSRQELMGIDLAGKTIGIVGVGRIGSNVACIAHGFKMNILGFDRHPRDELIKELGLQYVSFEELLQKSDIITFHVRLSPETRHLLNEKTFQLVKEGAYIINTSRGPVIDTEVLLEALSNGKIAGAGVDVFEGEQFVHFVDTILTQDVVSGEKLGVADNYTQLLERGVSITPHNAFNTKDALQRIMDTTVGNIHSYLEGHAQNLVQE